AELVRRDPDGDPFGTDPATLGGAIAAGMAGWGPVTISPTPTSRDRWVQFERTAWELHQAIASGQLQAPDYNLYLRRAELVPGPADPAAHHAAAPCPRAAVPPAWWRVRSSTRPRPGTAFYHPPPSTAHRGPPSTTRRERRGRRTSATVCTSTPRPRRHLRSCPSWCST